MSEAGSGVTPYYSDDSVTIYHGDCQEVLPELSFTGEALVTDPPYGLGPDVLHKSGRGQWEKFYKDSVLAWDAAPVQWLPELVEMFSVAIVWGGNNYPLPPSRGWLIWDKIVREFSSGHAEIAWTSLSQPIRAFSWAHAQLASEGKEHPTQKPLPLMRWCLGFVDSSLLVVDPFMGSGTTLRAAKDLGRKAIGIEIEERYCEVAARRCSQEVLGLDAA